MIRYLQTVCKLFKILLVNHIQIVPGIVPTVVAPKSFTRRITLFNPQKFFYNGIGENKDWPLV